MPAIAACMIGNAYPALAGPCRNGERLANEMPGASSSLRIRPTWKSPSPTTGSDSRQPR